jgi:hypothetical protein
MSEILSILDAAPIFLLTWCAKNDPAGSVRGPDTACYPPHPSKASRTEQVVQLRRRCGLRDVKLQVFRMRGLQRGDRRRGRG